MKDENEVTEESSFKNFVEDGLPVMRKKVYSKVEEIKKILSYLGVSEEVPNVAVTLNNKIGEIYRRFKKCGVVLCTDSIEINENENVPQAYVGNAILNDLVDKCLDGMNQLNDVQAGCKNAGISRKKRVLNEFGRKGFKRILYGLRGEKYEKIIEQKRNLTDDEKKMISSPMERYKEIDRLIYEYDIDKEVTSCLIRFFVQNNRVVHYGKAIENFKSENFEKTFEKYVVPDMNQLGMESLIPEAKNEIMRVAEKIEGKKIKMDSVDILER